MNIVNIKDKTELKTIKHLFNHVSKDQARPVLTGIKIEQNICSAADGFRVTRVKTPDCLKEFAGKLIIFKKRPVSGVNEIDFISLEERNYPDCNDFFETENYNQVIRLNASFLVESLKDLHKDTCITLQIKQRKQQPDQDSNESSSDSASTFPLIITTYESAEIETSIIIMPMHADDNNGLSNFQESAEEESIPAAAS